MASSESSGGKRAFADTELPGISPHHKRRRGSHSDVDEDTDAIDDTAAATTTGFSSPLSDVDEDRLPTTDEFLRLEQERLTVESESQAQEEYDAQAQEEFESQVHEVIEVKTEEEGDPGKLLDDFKATLAQIKTANEGLLTPEAFEYLQSEVISSHLYSPEPKANDDTKPWKGVDAGTSTRCFIKVVRSSETQTEDVVPRTTTSTQTPAVLASDEVATQTESMVSNASVQTDPIPKTFPSCDEVYKKDLEYIRRAKPFVPSTDVITVKCRLRKEPTKTPSSSRFGKASYLPSPSKTHNGIRSSLPRPKSQVVSLVDDDDDVSMVEMPNNEGNWRTGGSRYGDDFVYGDIGGLGDADESDSYEAFEPVEFYGIQGATSVTRSRSLLRYQDRQTGFGEHPSPIAGLRLNQDKYRAEIGSKHFRDPIPLATDTLRKTSWGKPTSVDDDKEAIKSKWTSTGSYQLFKGFPLVEDVEFIVHRNMPPEDPDGDCYWRSVSFCLYGSDEHWDVVKAEHLGYLHYVLSQPKHPRHSLYREHLNARFFDTSSVNGSPFKANIWQLLHLAHAWTPAVISQITADLYNICVVIFTLENGLTTETNVRGVYNSRHIFLCFTNGCHFQPMTPNEYDAWEFKYPRITVEATSKYINAPKATSAKHTWEHPWRKEFSSTVLPPVPRLHGCNIEKLRHFLGSNPRP
ncbi:hypothetical protein PG988_004224 [Apiospora saccharicola]